MLGDLLVVGGALIFVLCVALSLRNMIALLPRYILAVFLGHLVTHLLGLAVTLGGWDYSSYRLLHILALGYWDWTTNWLQNSITFLLFFIVQVWNFDSVALLSRLIPTLLTWLIPAFLLSMFINTFSLSNSSTHFLSNSLALLFISVLCSMFLHNPTVLHVRDLRTQFLLLQLTLILCYIFSFSFSCGITNLFMFSMALFLILSLAFLGVFCVTFLFILSVTFLFIFIFTLLFSNLLTLLLWNRITLLFRLVVHFSVPHSVTLLFIISGALFIIGSHFMWHLYSVTFLFGFIPALFFPYCSTGRYTTVGTTNQKQEYQYLHAEMIDL